jgi:single-stranded DNA-binding protein
MRAIDDLILIAKGARDAELRHTRSGKAVARIQLATTRFVPEQEDPPFRPVVCWESLTETVVAYVKRGDALDVEGGSSTARFRTRMGGNG